MRPVGSILTLAVLLTGSASAQSALRRPNIDSFLRAAWPGFAGNAQHTAGAPARSQSFGQILWQTPVDLAPQYDSEGELLIHYGSPVITSQNTVIVPVKTGATGGFRLDAHKASDGSLVWSATTDYILPSADWTPEFGPTLTTVGPAGTRLYYPGAGGTVYYRDDPDAADGASGQIAFYGLTNYEANRAAYNSAVTINTPLTADADGNIYFGFLVAEHAPGGLASGIARISATGQGTWISAASAASDSAITQVVYNCAPALSGDLKTLYVAVSNGYNGAGYLLAVDSASLQRVARVELIDPATGMDALLSSDGSASPTVGPDGNVYFGVLESSGENHYRGLPAVKEWCINSAVVDPASGSILAGSEDGTLYRWNLSTNTFSERIVLTPGLGEAYTPTIVGPDGLVYAIHNATLFVIANAH